MRYRVTAGFVTVEMGIPGGRARQDVRRGALLPVDVSPAEGRSLLALGYVEPVTVVDTTTLESPEPTFAVVEPDPKPRTRKRTR